MRCPSAIADEVGRLQALAEYGLSEDTELPTLEPIMDIVVRMFGVPAAAVNMIGSDHVFFAASKGIGDCNKARDVSFCAHTITQDGVMVVDDAALDPRFHDNPLVADGMIHFYAGVTLKSASGHAIGALCIIDDAPRAEFTEQDRTHLKDLARLVSDRLELRRLERAASIPQSRFEASAVTSPHAVICFDDNSEITAWNESAETIFGYHAEDIIGHSIDVLIAERDREKVHAGIKRVLAGADPDGIAADLVALRSDGERFPVELHWSRWFEGETMHFGAIIKDTTDQRRERDALYHLANYDSLTGLPNRNYLHRRAASTIEDGSGLALIVTDLDGFKDVNDTLGPAAGDQVLQVVTDRMLKVVPPSSIIARIGGDEFATLVIGEVDPMKLNWIARDIIAAIVQPIVVGGHEVRISGSCGLAIAPDHGDTIDELTSSADLALFQAKNGGRGRSCLFTPALRAEAVARRMYDAELHRAVERDEFVLFYQPQIRLSDGALIGAEALIRWKHPVRGLLSPAAFLHALENGPLAARVGTWIIRSACAQAAFWRREQADFHVSVNLFAAQFRADNLLEVVSDALDAYQLTPDALELEITENIILDGQDRVLAQLQDLRGMGIELSFDDFGTGYASLNLLKTYPVTHIKIDKSFTQAVQTSPGDRAIVGSILDLAHQLGLKVVAEGVESQQSSDFLRRHGCEKGQGYYFGRPVPADLFAEQFWPKQIAIRLI